MALAETGPELSISTRPRAAFAVTRSTLGMRPRVRWIRISQERQVMPATLMTSVTVSPGSVATPPIPLGTVAEPSGILFDGRPAVAASGADGSLRVSVGRFRWLDVVFGWRRDIGTRAPLRGRQRGSRLST